MRHVLFTEPAALRAGQPATLYYSPADTPLAGEGPPLFVTGGWNRWEHPKRFGPLEMKVPEAGATHYQARASYHSCSVSITHVGPPRQAHLWLLCWRARM